MIMSNLNLIYNNKQIIKAIVNIATSINADFKDKNPLLLCVLNGAIVFFANLLTRLNIDCEIDSASVTRYGNKSKGGKVVWQLYPQKEIKNKDIIIVDDVLDEAITALELIKYCKQKQAKSIKTVFLFDKNKKTLIPDYAGLTVPDKFIVGFGLDKNEKYRNLNSLYHIQ
jgi:hypoxanthine phosphoribosyltransferase